MMALFTSNECDNRMQETYYDILRFKSVTRSVN